MHVERLHTYIYIASLFAVLFINFVRSVCSPHTHLHTYARARWTYTHLSFKRSRQRAMQKQLYKEEQVDLFFFGFCLSRTSQRQTRDFDAAPVRICLYFVVVVVFFTIEHAQSRRREDAARGLRYSSIHLKKCSPATKEEETVRKPPCPALPNKRDRGHPFSFPLLLSCLPSHTIASSPSLSSLFCLPHAGRYARAWAKNRKEGSTSRSLCAKRPKEKKKMAFPGFFRTACIRFCPFFFSSGSPS